MNREALFCDGTQDYVIPAEPDANEKIVLKFRTAHNDVEEVKLLTGDRSYSMWKISAGDEFDFYEIEWQLGTEPFHYSFEIKSGEQLWFYNRYGVSDHREDYYAYTIVRDSRRRNGQKVRLCIRSSWIDSSTGIRQMMWKMQNISILERQLRE